MESQTGSGGKGLAELCQPNPAAASRDSCSWSELLRASSSPCSGWRSPAGPSSPATHLAPPRTLNPVPRCRGHSCPGTAPSMRHLPPLCAACARAWPLSVFRGQWSPQQGWLQPLWPSRAVQVFSALIPSPSHRRKNLSRPWASPSTHWEGLGAAIPAAHHWGKPRCPLCLRLQAPAETPPAPKQAAPKSSASPEHGGAEGGPTRCSPCSSLLMAVTTASLGSSAVHPGPGEQPVPPPPATPLPTAPPHLLAAGSRAEASPAPQVGCPKASQPSRPGTCKGGDLRHLPFELAAWFGVFLFSQPSSALNQRWGWANKQDPPSSPPSPEASSLLLQKY